MDWKRPTCCQSVDEKVRTVNISEPAPSTISTECSSVKELELAKYENEALRAYLANELGKLKKENEKLKQKLQDVQALNEEHPAEHPSIGPSDFEGAPQPTHVTRNESNESNDEMIKQFTSIPKTLLEFYDQMERGSSKMPKFSDLPQSFRTSISNSAYVQCKI